MTVPIILLTACPTSPPCLKYFVVALARSCCVRGPLATKLYPFHFPRGDNKSMRILVVSDISRKLARSLRDRAAVRRVPLPRRPGRLRPDSVPCVRWAMTHATYAIRGNHDHGVAQGIPGHRRAGVPVPHPHVAPLDVGRSRARGTAYLLQLPVTHASPSGVGGSCWSTPLLAIRSTSTCSRTRPPGPNGPGCGWPISSASAIRTSSSSSGQRRRWC